MSEADTPGPCATAFDTIPGGVHWNIDGRAEEPSSGHSVELAGARTAGMGPNETLTKPQRTLHVRGSPTRRPVGGGTSTPTNLHAEGSDIVSEHTAGPWKFLSLIDDGHRNHRPRSWQRTRNESWLHASRPWQYCEIAVGRCPCASSPRQTCWMGAHRNGVERHSPGPARTTAPQ